MSTKAANLLLFQNSYSTVQQRKCRFVIILIDTHYLSIPNGQWWQKTGSPKIAWCGGAVGPGDEVSYLQIWQFQNHAYSMKSSTTIKLKNFEMYYFLKKYSNCLKNKSVPRWKYTCFPHGDDHKGKSVEMEEKAAKPFKDVGPSQAEHLFLEALQALKGLFKETEKLPGYQFSSSNN